MYSDKCSKCECELPVFAFSCPNCENQCSIKYKSLNPLLYYITTGLFAICMGLITGCLLAGLKVGFFHLFDLNDNNFLLYNLLVFAILIFGFIIIALGMKTVFNLILYRFLLPFVFKLYEDQKVSPQG